MEAGPEASSRFIASLYCNPNRRVSMWGPRNAGRSLDRAVFGGIASQKHAGLLQIADARYAAPANGPTRNRYGRGSPRANLIFGHLDSRGAEPLFLGRGAYLVSQAIVLSARLIRLHLTRHAAV